MQHGQFTSICCVEEICYGQGSVFVVALNFSLHDFLQRVYETDTQVLTGPVLTGGQSMGWWSNVGKVVYVNMQCAYTSAQVTGAQIANMIIAQFYAQMPNMPVFS